MVFTFGSYIVDVERTRQLYTHTRTVSEGCCCDGCLNFEKAVDYLPMQIRDFFESLGVDLRKACECYVNCVNENGTLLYGGWYHIFGNIISGDSAWKKTGENSAFWDNNVAFAVTQDFRVSFENEVYLQKKEYPFPTIQLEFVANIPWVLDKKNAYL